MAIVVIGSGYIDGGWGSRIESSINIPSGSDFLLVVSNTHPTVGNPAYSGIIGGVIMTKISDVEGLGVFALSNPPTGDQTLTIVASGENNIAAAHVSFSGVKTYRNYINDITYFGYFPTITGIITDAPGVAIGGTIEQGSDLYTEWPGQIKLIQGDASGYSINISEKTSPSSPESFTWSGGNQNHYTFGLLLEQSGQMAFPTADVTSGLWAPSSGSLLYSMINETTYSDSNYIYSSYDPSNDYCEVLLSGLSDPYSSNDHIVSYRYRVFPSPTSSGIDLTIGLYQATNLVAECIHSGIGSDFVLGSFTLTGTQADSITNYTDLRLRFKANKR